MSEVKLLSEIEQRRARRAISDEPIPEEVLTRVLQAAHLAPSCGNRQPWRLLVCSAGEPLKAVRDSLSSGNYWAKRAPVLVVVMTKDDLDVVIPDGRAYAQFDTGMAAMNLQLQAVHEGLYTHPMAGFDPESLRSHFDIRADTRILTVVALGYPGEADTLSEKHQISEKSERDRKELQEVVGLSRLPPDV